LGIEVAQEAQARLCAYLELLAKWNEAYNLTSIREPADMVSRHLLDSLAAEPYLLGERVVDVGSGAGLPGIPLAIARPELSFALVEPQHKKARFLRHAAHQINLSNVEVICAQVQDYRPAQKFDTLVSRAFAHVGKLLASAGHLCAGSGRVLAFKGKYPAAELEQAGQQGFSVAAVKSIAVPGLNVQRHLVILSARPSHGPERNSQPQSARTRSGSRGDTA